MGIKCGWNLRGAGEVRERENKNNNNKKVELLPKQWTKLCNLFHLIKILVVYRTIIVLSPVFFLICEIIMLFFYYFMFFLRVAGKGLHNMSGLAIHPCVAIRRFPSYMITFNIAQYFHCCSFSIAYFCWNGKVIDYAIFSFFCSVIVAVTR